MVASRSMAVSPVGFPKLLEFALLGSENGCLPPGSDRPLLAGCPAAQRWRPQAVTAAPRRPSFLFLFRAVPASGRALLCEAGRRCWEGRGPGEPLLDQVPAVLLLLLPGRGHPAGGQARLPFLAHGVCLPPPLLAARCSSSWPFAFSGGAAPSRSAPSL